MYIIVRVDIYTYKYVYICIHRYRNIYIHTSIYTYVYVYIYIQHAYINLYTCMYNIYIYIYCCYMTNDLKKAMLLCFTDVFAFLGLENPLGEATGARRIHSAISYLSKNPISKA